MSTLRRAIIGIIALTIVVFLALPTFAQSPETGQHIGQIIIWSGSGSNIPYGYIQADGSCWSTVVFPELYAVIGTTYGTSGGDFCLPNMVGRVPLGADINSSTPGGNVFSCGNQTCNYDLGDTGGVAGHQLTVGEMPTHNHNTYSLGQPIASGPPWNTIPIGKGGLSQNIGISNTGYSQYHNNVQPYLSLIYLIAYTTSITNAAPTATPTPTSTPTPTATPTPVSTPACTMPDFPSTSLLDDANRADEGPPPGPGWTTVSGEDGLVVSGNEILSDPLGGGSGTGYWNTSFGPDSEVNFTLTGLMDDTQSLQLYIRADDTMQASGYEISVTRDDANGDGVALAVIGGSQLDTASINLSAGDKIGARAAGQTITVYHQPVAGDWTELINVSDSTYTDAGYIGLWLNTGAIDDFSGGNVTCTAATIPTPDAYTSTLPSGKTLYIPILFSFGEIVMATLALGVCAVLGYSFLFGMVYHK